MLTPLILLAPALLGGRAKPARFLAGLAPALLIPYLPYLITGGAIGSLFESGTRWTGGAVIFSLLTLAIVPEIARLLCAGDRRGGGGVDRATAARARRSRRRPSHGPSR